MDPKSSGQIGKWALIYYFSTTMMAVVLGIVLVILIHPGSADIKRKLGQGTNERTATSTLDSFLDLMRYLNCVNYGLHAIFDLKVTSIILF